MNNVYPLDRSQTWTRMSGTDKTLNSEKSFRVVVRLCTRENTHSHTGLIHTAMHNVYFRFDFVLTETYPDFIIFKIITKSLTQTSQFLSEQSRALCLYWWTQSLHQSDTSQQISCWHWKGECCVRMNQRYKFITFIILLTKNSNKIKWMCLHNIVFSYIVIILQSHKRHIIDFDAVLNEEVSQRDVYESTAKVFFFTYIIFLVL